MVGFILELFKLSLTWHICKKKTSFKGKNAPDKHWQRQQTRRGSWDAKKNQVFRFCATCEENVTCYGHRTIVRPSYKSCNSSDLNQPSDKQQWPIGGKVVRYRRCLPTRMMCWWWFYDWNVHYFLKFVPILSSFAQAINCFFFLLPPFVSVQTFFPLIWDCFPWLHATDTTSWKAWVREHKPFFICWFKSVKKLNVICSDNWARDKVPYGITMKKWKKNLQKFGPILSGPNKVTDVALHRLM